MMKDHRCITCKCGHQDLFDKFTTTPINGALPKNHYQCPKCKKGWSINHIGKAKVFKDGFVIPSEKVISSKMEVL